MLRSIGWDEREVWVDLAKAQVQDSPPYDPSDPVDRQHETRVYDDYGRTKYWK